MRDDRIARENAEYDRKYGGARVISIPPEERTVIRRFRLESTPGTKKRRKPKRDHSRPGAPITGRWIGTVGPNPHASRELAPWE